MHASRELITGFLKRDLGFGGIVISDWAGIHQLPGDFPAQVRAGVRAGIDMFMEPDRFADFRSTLIAEVRAGRIPVSRIDDAVRRILRKKFELGLFEHPLTDRRRLREVGSHAHRALARRAVARSQVLLRNRHRVLPLRRGARVYVAGSKADSIGDQAGGWTLSWQGSSANVIPGTTILAGIRRALRGRMAPVPRGVIGVVVVGETPYAEYFGDVGGPGGQTMELSAADGAAVDRVCAAARRCVVVVVSGRPLVIEPARLRAIDGLVAAWLPGSEGAGVADALFGRRPYTGRLPVSWPRSLAQEPVNLGDRGYDPLYRLGFGLRTH
jgi:beta-glucosidase